MATFRRQVTAGDISTRVDLGAAVALDTKAFDLAQTLTDGGLDTIFLAIGARTAKRLGATRAIIIDRHTPCRSVAGWCRSTSPRC